MRTLFKTIFFIIFASPQVFGATTTTQGPVNFPNLGGSVSAIEASTLSLTAADHKVAFSLQAPRSGSVRKVYFSTATVTTGDTLAVSLQNVDPSLTYLPPDGVVDQSGTIIVADTDDSKTLSVTLGTDRTVVQGDWVSVVIGYSSYVAGSMSLGVAGTSNRGSFSHLYTTAWARQVKAPICALEYSDGSIYPIQGVYPPGAYSYASVSSTTTPDEIGNAITLEFQAVALGAYFSGRINAGMEIKLYNGSTVMSTITVPLGAYAADTTETFFFYFPAPQPMTAGTKYRITAHQTGTTISRVSNYTGTTGLEYLLNGFSGGINVYQTERTDSGTFTDSTNKMSQMGLILQGFDDGAGSIGGGVSTYAY